MTHSLRTGKSPCSKDRSTIEMVMFISYGYVYLRVKVKVNSSSVQEQRFHDLFQRWRGRGLCRSAGKICFTGKDVGVRTKKGIYMDLLSSGKRMERSGAVGVFIFPTYSVFTGEPVGATNRVSQPSDSLAPVIGPTKRCIS